ncbi:hypothetical protein QR680_008170 [Steinernema hermaphroditum]|nr:hypothetical protein QR680_008170 [Steinernema hermaphroditum]
MERTLLEQNQELADKMNREAGGIFWVGTSSEYNPILPVFPRMPGQEKLHTSSGELKKSDDKPSNSNDSAKLM